jgi:hypothetical protein
VKATVNYALNTGKVERFHSNDHGLDTVRLDPRTVEVIDARTLGVAPGLETSGFELFRSHSAVADWLDDAQVQETYPVEIRRFMKAVTGADEVVTVGPGILRWSERSPQSGSRDASDPARLIHSDASAAEAARSAARANPRPERTIRRAVHHNIWRAFSGPPVDLPLAVCDASTISSADMIDAVAAFDVDGVITWTLDALNFSYSPKHRWMFYADMRPDEVLVFKGYDTDPERPKFTPHTAIDDPTVGPEATPRASVEIRTISYWYA